MKISNQGLFLTTALAIVSIFGLNYWVYNVDFIAPEDKDSEIGWFCGTSDYNYGAVNVSELTIEDQELYSIGEGIFNANCTQCHSVHQKIVGPALKNSWQNWANDSELMQFIKYPQRTIDSGNSEHAVALYKEYKQYMPNHEFLTHEELKGLIAYIKGQSGYTPIVALSDIP